VSGFILAAQKSDKRIPLDQYFPSQPQRTSSGGPNHSNVCGYHSADVFVAKSVQSSSLQSTNSEGATGHVQIEHKPRKSVQFEDKLVDNRGFFSAILSVFKGGPASNSFSTFKPGSTSQGGPATKVDPASESQSALKSALKSNGKAASMDDSTPKGDTAPRGTSISKNEPAAKDRPAFKDKGKGKAVSLEGAPYDSSAQTDGPAPEDESAIMDSPTQQDEPKSKPYITSYHGMANSGRMQDTSERLPSGFAWGKLRTTSPARRPDFTIRHYPPEGPSVSSAAVNAPLLSPNTTLEAGKLLVQNRVKHQLGIDRIPSPTRRPNKTFVETAIGYFYGFDDSTDESDGRGMHGGIAD
jgi:hypothetical protein